MCVKLAKKSGKTVNFSKFVIQGGKMKKTFSTTLALFLLSIGVNQSVYADLNTGLVTHLNFDNCNSDDISGNKNDAVVTYQNVAGQNVPAALSCDENGIQKTKALDLNKTFGKDREGFALYIQNAKSLKKYSTNVWLKFNDDADLDGTKVDKNKWVLLTATYDGNQFTYYLDGKVVQTFKTNQATFTGNIHLLSDFIDDVRIYNRALSTTEVIDLVKEGANEKNTVTQGIESLCMLDSNSGSELAKIAIVDVSNEVFFSKKAEEVIEYQKLLASKNSKYATYKNLNTNLRNLQSQNKKILDSTLGKISGKDGNALSNYRKFADGLLDVEMSLAEENSIAKKEVVNSLKKLKTTPVLWKNAKAFSDGLTIYSTACGTYELFQDIKNYDSKKAGLYDWLELALHAKNTIGGFVSLYELSSGVKLFETSKGYSTSTAILLGAEVYAKMYEAGRDHYLNQQFENTLKTHQSNLELRYSIIDSIVDELTKKQTLDELRYSLFKILNRYPVFHDTSISKDFAAGDMFLNQYLNNTAFLKKQFNKQRYEDLTNQELANVAAIYVLGEISGMENRKLKDTAVKNWTKEISFWSLDGLAGAFGGKDAYKIFKENRDEIIKELGYDVYDNLRYRFDSSFAKKQYEVLQQLGEKIYALEGVTTNSNDGVATSTANETFPTDGYTKIANDGSKLPDSATLGANPKDWACTRDNKTGLIWEVKTTDGGLRDMNNYYSWYEPDASKNGGFAGYQNSGSCKGSECDTYAFTNAVNTQGLCGAKDWRMPSADELNGLLTKTKTLNQPFNDTSYRYIDAAYFPNTEWWFWSFTPISGYSPSAWGVTFELGYFDPRDKEYGYSIRLVRGGQ